VKTVIASSNLTPCFVRLAPSEIDSLKGADAH
jgi:hypothetical protein